MASGISGLFRGLFGRGGGAEPAKAADSVEYNGYIIRPAPRRQAAGWLTAGTISKQFPDGSKEHQFIRADTNANWHDAVEFCVRKGKQIVDEQGDRIFGE
jgi:hypothetical protein